MSNSLKKITKTILVYTDGSCINNGKKTAVGGIGIHFPHGELPDISQVYRREHCTNQRTELYAILTALRYIKRNFNIREYHITIKTDSQYSINCITQWVYGWIKNNWKTKSDTPVLNRDFIEPIHKYYEAYDIELEHVDAHTNGDDSDSIANAQADKLATDATKKALKDRTRTGSGSVSTRKSFNKMIKRTVEETPITAFPTNANFSVELVKTKN